MSFNKCRSISFKLNEQIDMESLTGKAVFQFERNYQSGDQQMKDVIKCRVLGIKQNDWIQDHPIPSFEGADNDIQWVEISGSE